MLASSALLVTMPVGLAHADGPAKATPRADGTAAADRAPVTAVGSRATRTTYVAMGDSYSSGEGLFLYKTGTDTSTNQCHRSPLAYGPLLTYALPRTRSLSFVACSGSATVDLYRPNHNYPSEAPQLAAVTSATRTVTLTLGGNDIGFVQVLGACIRPRALSTTPCTADPRVPGGVALGLAGLNGTQQVPPIVPMTKVLSDIAAKAPDATIYVGGYPELFGDDRDDFSYDPVVPSRRSCTLLDTGSAQTTAVIDYEDAQFINTSAQRLNAVLASAVTQVKAQGVRARFVPASTFAGHGLCDAKHSWINPVIPTEAGLPRPESLHPNLLGSLGYATAFWRAFTGQSALPAAVRRQAEVR